MKKKPKPRRWSAWKTIGSIAVDTGTIMICDPCQALQADSPINKRYQEWGDFVDAITHIQDYPDLPETLTAETIAGYIKETKKVNRRKPRLYFPIGERRSALEAICISTAADGCYDIEMRKRGHDTEVMIRF